MQKEDIVKKTINCIRILSLECVEEAKSGHPGLPLGAAEIFYVLWHKHMIFCPEDPKWLNRDRFILSAGHGSAGLYSLLYMYGFLSIEDLKRFRQFKSKTPGHPEYGLTPGVETTTGPLGQGFATAVGIALGQRILQQKLKIISSELSELINHKVYVLVGDGDLMEGVSYEAGSLAGHLCLNNLIVIYDSNKTTIDGSTDLTFTEDVDLRFKAFGWEVVKIDGHNLEQLDSSLNFAKKSTKPFLIIASTKIAKCSPNFEGSHKAHGAPLGEDEVCKIKEKLMWSKEKFYVPDDVKNYISLRLKELKKEYERWQDNLKNCLKKYPKLKSLLDDYLSTDLDKSQLNDLLLELKNLKFDKEFLSTRTAFGNVLQIVAKKIDKVIVGSADLAHSTNALIKDSGAIQKDNFNAKNIYFGVREHAMGCISNGLALYNFRPICSTFLVFSDYMRPPIRLASMMKLPVVFVFSHDSVFIGEDGPTHQPVEHLISLRAIPGLYVIRPADAYETLYAVYFALRSKDKPVALILTRQDVAVLDRKKFSSASGLLKGGYIISKEKNKTCDIILIATGSEVYLAIQVQELLQKDGFSVRVVSMPSVELFEEQPQNYRDEVIPQDVKIKVVIEASRTIGWQKYAGDNGLIIGIDHFGNSAPYKILQQEYGFTAEKIYEKLRKHFKI